MFPLILAAVLGFAFRNSGPEANRVGLLGEAARLEQTLVRDPRLEVELYDDEGEALLELRNGNVDVLLLPGAAPGDEPVVRLDPQRPDAEVARVRVARALEHPAGDLGDGPFVVEEVTAVGSRYIDFLYPGLLGMNLMGTGMWSIGFGVADMRRRKVLKRMLVTPMRRSSLLLSYLLSRMVFLAAEVALLLGFGSLVLGVPFRGGILAFLALCFVGAAIFSGLGLLACSRVRTLEGASGILNLVMMPMWLGSGVFFSYERFPEATHGFLRCLPLSALNDALRRVMLDGGGMADIGFELAVQVVWGVAGFFAALWLFRWD